MLLEIAKVVEPIASDPNVRLVVLYRIDGTPILVKVNDKSQTLLRILYWLENQIKDTLYHIFNRSLDDLSFRFKEVVVKMYPVSRTLVLTVIVDEESSLYKLEADIETVCMRIREIIGYEC
jgi:predicted regulator of Ras-like GTPase activity (Roadblock/LC7/MglB family)